MANPKKRTPATLRDAIPVNANTVAGRSPRRRRRALHWAGLFVAAAGAANGSLRADDLGRLLEDRPAPSAEKLAETAPPSEVRPEGGEDLGDRGESDIRLKAIERTMAEVTEGLLASKTGAEIQRLQREALRELDALIADLESSTQSSRPGAARAGAASGDGGGASESQGRPTAGGQGSDNDGPAAPPGLRKIWGHLPLRVRDRMRGAAVERFLPGYELLIEEYYKRLAEPQGFGP